jgi:hypothetical protein
MKANIKDAKRMRNNLLIFLKMEDKVLRMFYQKENIKGNII